MLNGLVDSIGHSGDGRSPTTAFVTISTPELRAFLRLTGLEVKKQSLVHEADKAFDLMGVRDPETGEEFELYFDITTQMTKGFKGLR